MLSEAAIDDVVSCFKDVFNHTVCHLRAGVSHKLSQSGIEIDGLNDVCEQIGDPFAGLESAYLQDKFISQELGCIISIFL